MIAAVALLACLQDPSATSQAIYDAVQLRLSKAKTVRVTLMPTTGDSWDRETWIYYQRPDKHAVYGQGYIFKTDGKRTTSTEGSANFNRPRRSEDMQSLFWLQPFWNGKAKVEAVGGPRKARVGSLECTLLDLRVEGKGSFTLYLHPDTGLPFGVNDEQGKMNPSYKVELDVPLDPALFRVAAPMPASQVYERVWRKVAKLRSITLHRYFTPERRSGDSISGLQPDMYRRESKGETVVAKGGWTYKIREGHTSRFRNSSPGAPELVPGYEAFFNPRHRATVHGLAPIVPFQFHECYRLNAAYTRPKRGGYHLYVEADSLSPTGYEELDSKGRVVKTGLYDRAGPLYRGADFFAIGSPP